VDSLPGKIRGGYNIRVAFTNSCKIPPRPFGPSTWEEMEEEAKEEEETTMRVQLGRRLCA